MVVGGIISMTVLLVLYGPYTRLILGIAHRVSSSRRNLMAFIGVLFVMPLILLAF
jgi:hypothetical protein